MSSGIDVHLQLHVIFHVVLAKHRVATGAWRDLLHPVLVFAFHLTIVVNLAVSWQDGQLSAVNNIGNAALSSITILFFHWLIVFHLALKISKILPDLLVSNNGLLICGFLDFLGKDNICTITFLQTSFHLLDNIDLLLLHLHDSPRQSSGLPLIVIHVLI